MTGDEQVLNVYLGEHPIAHITLIKEQLYWHYHEDWQQIGYAVSPHLLLQGDIPPFNVQQFLRNLLPEGNPLDILVHSFHLSKYNTFGLVRALGLDIPGSFIGAKHLYNIN